MYKQLISVTYFEALPEQNFKMPLIFNPLQHNLLPTKWCCATNEM